MVWVARIARTRPLSGGSVGPDRSTPTEGVAMADTLKGTCLCGKVEYEVKDPEALGYCHCTRCQRWTGSSLAGVVVAKENFHFTKGEDLVKRYESEFAPRNFCSNCGSSIYDDLGEKYFVAAGLMRDLDLDSQLPPAGRLQGQLARDRRRRSAVRRERLTPARAAQPPGAVRPQGSAPREPGLVPGWLEELHRIAGRILDQYLFAADTGDDVVAEARSRHRAGAEPSPPDRPPRAGSGSSRRARARVPSGIAWPPPGPPPGALSTSRRSPRESIANAGAGCMTS